MAGSVRADARRNRERLVAAATAAFGRTGPAASLEAIARDAGVGIGTLYRHFPTREALTAVVYRTELAEVIASAAELVQRHRPVDALRAWMERYADFVAAKQGMAQSLRALLESGDLDRDQTRQQLRTAVALIVAAGVRDGTLRPDVDADDVLSAMLGVALASTTRDQASRLMVLLLDGLVATR